MKRIYIAGAAAAILLFAASASGEESLINSRESNREPMITNEELPTATPEQDDATFNQMPGGRTEGSSPGGVNNDLYDYDREPDSELKSKPDDAAPVKPGPEPFGTDLYGPDY